MIDYYNFLMILYNLHVQIENFMHISAYVCTTLVESLLTCVYSSLDRNAKTAPNTWGLDKNASDVAFFKKVLNDCSLLLSKLRSDLVNDRCAGSDISVGKPPSWGRDVA